MFFNIKEAAEHGVNIGTNWASYLPSISEEAIRFEPVLDEYRAEEGELS